MVASRGVVAVSVCACGLASAVVLSQVLAADAPDGGNLIQSPSFEEPANDQGWPPGWFGLYSVPADGYRFDIAGDGRTGKKSLVIEGKGQFGVAWGHKLRIDPEHRYRARGYVRIDGNAQAAADVKLHYYGEGMQYLGQSRVGFVNPRTPGWQLITVTDQLELFPEAKFVGIAVALAGDGKAGFDDIELRSKKEKRGPVNFVANGDMEDIAADRPAGYFVFGAEGSRFECRTNEEKPFSGKRSLRLSGDGDWAVAGGVQVEPGARKAFTAAGQARVIEGHARLQIGYFDRSYKFLGVTSGEAVGPGDWQKLTVSSELERFPEAARINVGVRAEGKGAADFDELTMVPTK